MKSRRLNHSKEVSQTITQLSSRHDADEESLSEIPIELIIEIFSRLPLKSIGRCRCVSKQWGSILRRQDFTDLFFTRSSARPKLMLAFQRNHNELVFFSSPQPQPRENASLIATDHHLSFRVDHSYHISSIINGLFCITHYGIRGKNKERVFVICNPNTRRSFTLPRTKTNNRIRLTGFLGYDPIEKQHKVLTMTERDDRSDEHQVLTLETGKLTWRMVECGIIPHGFPWGESVCINGVVYYTAWDSFGGGDMVICFDVRSEKYSFVKAPARRMLINFQGKLASVRSRWFNSETSFNLEMWVLEDSEKHEWSKRVFHLPPMCKRYLDFVGVTATNELAFSPSSPSHPFHVYFYDFVKEAIKRVEIQGFGALYEYSKAHLILNHVEDAKIMC